MASKVEKAVAAEIAAEEHKSKAEVALEEKQAYHDWEAASEEFANAAGWWRDDGDDKKGNADRLATEAKNEEAEGKHQLDLVETP